LLRLGYPFVVTDPLQRQAPPAVTVLGIELAARGDVILAQRANVSLINAVRADLRDVEDRLSTKLDERFAEVDAKLSAILDAVRAK
jgi:hypothetical protein